MKNHESSCKVIGVISNTHGYHSIKVSEEDFEMCRKYRWHLDKDKYTYYALTDIFVDGVKKTLSMHRLITQAEPGLVVDHIDGNGLNNTRDNLRVVSQLTNSRNKRIAANNKSGVSGVCFYSHHDQWVAQARDHEQKFLRKCFSAKKYGFDKAKDMAIEQRRKWEAEYGYIVR